jgi:carboxylate-amine ligase
MEIPFRSSPRPTLGVEVELGIVDRVDRELTSAGSELLAELGVGHPEGTHPRAKHELFECTVEVITGICNSVAEAGGDLRATITELERAASGRGLAIVSSGTHPFSHWSRQRISPDPRYEELVDLIGWPARRLAIHGTHFHVGVRSGPAAVAVTNAVTVHLPVFLALSASSPFWHGDDTGLASARTKVFEGLPTAGLPPRLGDWADFEALMETLLTAEAIRSIREVWWDVRPHPDFGTVELRMCDALSTLDETLSLAALAQSLVADLQERFEAGAELPSLREWVLRENKWLAARHGLDAELIVDDRGTRRPARDSVRALVEQLRPTAQRLGCDTELDGVLGIIDRGPGYVRQRRIMAEGGTMEDVVDRLVDEYRVAGVEA